MTYRYCDMSSLSLVVVIRFFRDPALRFAIVERWTFFLLLSYLILSFYDLTSPYKLASGYPKCTKKEGEMEER